MVPPSIPQMQRIQNSMDNLLYCINLGVDEKAKKYMELQNKFLTYEPQLKSFIPEATIPTQSQEPNHILQVFWQATYQQCHTPFKNHCKS